MSISRLSLFLLAGLIPGAALADDAVPAVVSSCVSCHSADGNPLVEGVPILAGQRALYLERALKAYRAGQRSGGPADVMRAYSESLTDSEIQEIATWFSEN